MENGELIKHGAAVHSSPLNYVKEVEMTNSYGFVGHTKSTNEDILQISESPDKDLPITLKPRRVKLNHLYWQQWTILGRSTILYLTIARWSPAKSQTKLPVHCQRGILLLTPTRRSYARAWWKSNKFKGSAKWWRPGQKAWTFKLKSLAVRISSLDQPSLSSGDWNYKARGSWHVHCLWIMNLAKTIRRQDIEPL